MNVYVVTIQWDIVSFVKKVFSSKENAVDYIKNFNINDLPEEWFDYGTPILKKDLKDQAFPERYAVITDDYAIDNTYINVEGSPCCVYGRTITYNNNVDRDEHYIVFDCYEVSIEEV